MSAFPPCFSGSERIGPYTLLRRIGGGQAGEVWLAERDSQLAKTRLAVKLLGQHVDVEEIRQEAQLWIEVANHPNILPLFEANYYDGRFVLVSEYVPDGSLHDWVRRQGEKALPVHATLRIVLGILGGLAHLHARGVIHRDVKPANVLMQQDTPRLADFGLARKPALDGSTCRIAGTPLYMAPEAFDGMRTPQTDLWSVGVLFYQLLSGRLPFGGKGFTSLINAIRHSSPAPLSPDVPEPVTRVLWRALENDSSRRYGAAADMRAELNNLLQGLGASSSSDTPSQERPQETQGCDAYIKLEVKESTGRGELLVFDPKHDRRVIIGRAKECDISLAEVGASRKHVMILYDRDKGWILQDLGSSNGVFLNQTRVEKAILKPGDRIRIGSTLILVHDMR